MDDDDERDALRLRCGCPRCSEVREAFTVYKRGHVAIVEYGPREEHRAMVREEA